MKYIEQMEPQYDAVADLRAASGFRVTLVGALTNIALAIIKFIVGVAGNSTALIADAVHSLSDLATDVVVYFSLKISSRKPDEDHPYGHGRAETIGATFIGAAIVFVGVGIAWEVMTRLLGGALPVPAPIAIGAAALSIAMKEALYRYTARVGRQLRSEAIMANAWHHRTDAVSSIAALVGIAGAVSGYPLMDPLAAVVVGLMIARVGGKIGWDAIQNLMDTGVSPEELEKMEGIIKASPGVVHFHELKTRRLGKDTLVDLHIQVPPRISISEAHNIAETVRHNLRHTIDQVTDALVHIDAEDDGKGRLYSVDRPQLEEIIKTAFDKISEIKLTGDIILHYFIHQVCVDITVEIDDKLTVGEAKENVKQLKEELLGNPLITEVCIHHNLGQWEKAQ